MKFYSDGNPHRWITEPQKRIDSEYNTYYVEFPREKSIVESEILESQRSHVQRQYKLKKLTEATFIEYRDKWTNIKSEQKKEYRRSGLELEPTVSLTEAPEAPEPVPRTIHAVHISRTKATQIATTCPQLQMLKAPDSDATWELLAHEAVPEDKSRKKPRDKPPEVLLHSLQFKIANECIKNDPVAVPSELSALLSLLPALCHQTLPQFRPGSAFSTDLSRVSHCRVSLRHRRHLTLPLRSAQDKAAAEVYPRRVLTLQHRDQVIFR
jgi:hypothetical protein